MKIFSNYVLSEAKVSARNFPRMVELIIQVLERRTGNKFYRVGGVNGITLTKRGIGLLYIYGKGQAIRFNHKGNDFESITLWKKYTIGAPGNITINLLDMNIVGSLEKIADAIMNPQTGKIQFYAESNKRSGRMLTEAKDKISPIDFHKLMALRLGKSPDGSLPLTKWSEIEKVAFNNSVDVPSVIKKMKVGGDRFDLNKIKKLDRRTQNLAENTILTEATRIKPIDFYQLFLDATGSQSGSLDRVTWEYISDMAIANDVQIPTVIRKMNVKTPQGVRYDLNDILKLDPKVQGVPAKEVEQISTIEVVSGDNNTDPKNIIPNQKKLVSDAAKKVEQIATNPTAQQIDDMTKKVDTLYNSMEKLIKIVTRGLRNSLVIVGGAGTGKTFTVTKTIEKEGLAERRDWFMIKGKISTAELYKLFYMHRDGGLLVFDDTDDVWKDLEAANILKAALDSDDPRLLSWYSARTVNISKMSKNEQEEFFANLDLMIQDNPQNSKIKFPSEFVYRGRVIFISNLPLDKMDKAVLNRSMKIDMTLTPEELFMRIESILPFVGKPELTLDEKKEVLAAIKSEYYAGRLGSEPSIRTYVLAEPFFISGYPDWTTLIKFG